MKKENDEITGLFRSRLSDARMDVRDGFWDKLAQDVAGISRRRRILFFRMAAAASVLFVLAVSSAAFWYLSPREEDLEEAFTRAVATDSGQLTGDGVQMNPLPLLRTVSAAPAPVPSPGGWKPSDGDGEDSLSVTVTMSFSFLTTGSGGQEDRDGGYGGCWPVSQAGGDQTVSPEKDGDDDGPSGLPLKRRNSRWAVRAVAGTALPAGHGVYKMPVSAGITVERRWNGRWGVETGVRYSNLRSEGQRLHYLGIPLRVNFTFADTKRFDFYLTAGGIADKCVSGAPDNSFKEEPVQLALTGGIGMDYKINDRFAVFAEPGVSHHFKTDSQLATVRTERATNFNLLCGLRMIY